jgi:hypothetical protein
MYIEPKIESSYYCSNKGAHPSRNLLPYFYPKIGKTIYDVIMDKKPKIVVEFGVLNGFSTVCIAQALRDLGGGKLYSYDLWENYPYKRGNKQIVSENLEKYGLTEFVELCDGDFNDWCSEKHECDLLHLDINNDGNIISMVSSNIDWCDVLFEGGTYERDTCWWMEEFNRRPITDVKEAVGYKVLVEEFPGLSIIER